ncbi:MAG: hypothetical protein AAGF26_11940 [Cyanobacteria bacterium P01_G01_bin.49]
MIMRIKLMTDYYYYPLWNMDDPDNIDPHELPLKEETIKRLLQWSEVYNQILNIDDPVSSDFASEKEAEEFERGGFRLWGQLQKELEPDYEVFYFSEQQGKVLSP